MKLDKRKCRKFAVPDRKLPSGSGILHAKQINYIVTTAVKTVAHHRTLVLYICPRKQAAGGDCKPLWTMFQTKDDFLTLAKKEDSSTAWRTVSFDCLDRNTYDFSSQCAFYSNQDEKRVLRYFMADADTDGFQTLTSAQDAILKRRRQERQLTKEKAIVARMAGISALPQGLKGWINSVMPAYFFYDYQRGNKNTTGICSACGREVTLLGIKQGNKAVCPHCRHELIAKPRSRRGCNMFDRNTFQVIENTGDGGLLLRIVKVYYNYTGDTPKAKIYENARHFVRLGQTGRINVESYYYSSNGGLLTDWKSGLRPAYSQWQYIFEADMDGYLYPKNLPDVLRNTPWEYCAIDIFSHHKPIQVIHFLIAYLKHPRLEHLVKTGFYTIVSDMAYDGHEVDCLNESRNRTHQILGVAAEDVAFLRDMGADIAALKIFQQYTGIKDRQRLLLWQLEHDVKHNILPILKYITVHKLIRYTERQFLCLSQRKDKYGSTHYKKMQDVVTEYNDYLEMCHDLNYDLKNSFVLYPKDLQKSHDRVQKRFKVKENEQLLRDFKSAVQDVRKRMEFEFDNMKIVVPATPGELAAEGNALHHCVGRYAGSVAKQECMILFVRKSCEIDKPYYTVEIRGQEVIQVRGVGNSLPTEEVQRFIDKFKEQVLLQGSVNNAA